MSDVVVTVFWAPGCPHCDAAREYLSRTALTVEYRDVSTDRGAMADLLALTGQTMVPALTVNDEVTIGFDPARLEEMVDAAAGLPPASETDPDPERADLPIDDEPEALEP